MDSGKRQAETGRGGIMAEDGKLMGRVMPQLESDASPIGFCDF
jgi:hypothetical protein